MTHLDTEPRRTILVVDDAPEHVHILVELLKGIARVLVAPCGSKALELAHAADPPDLILLDVMMPDMDGYEVCKQLKRDSGTQEIPILFLTAMNDSRNEARGFASGASDYITKPFSPALVLARVHTHLEQRRLLATERLHLLAEKELHEKTLKGALAVILEMIAMEDPESSGWSKCLGDLSEQVARAMGMEEPWMVGLAGVLSRIGILAVPKPILDKVKRRAVLDSAERQAITRIPEIGYQLLKNIPRMEDVADMIYYSQKNYNGSGFPLDDLRGAAIPLGARILRVCQDFTNTAPVLANANRRLGDLFQNFSYYDMAALLALKKIVEAGYFTPREARNEVPSREIAFQNLDLGQVLDAPIQNIQGQVLLREGTVLSASLLEKLKSLRLQGGLKGVASIRVDTQKPNPPR